MDVAGDNQVNIEHDMFKQRLSSTGKLLGSLGAERIGQTEDFSHLAPDYCGSCYGAEMPMRKCCNTCDALKLAYQEKGWSVNSILKNASQCLRDISNPFAGVRSGEGCRIHGSMLVNKVAGNFHVSSSSLTQAYPNHLPEELPISNISIFQLLY